MDPAQVWLVPPYESSVQPPLTEALLDATERQLGVRLPESLVALLWGQNGGHLRVGFPVDRNYNTTHEVIRGIGAKSPRLEKAAWWHDPDWGPPRPADAESPLLLVGAVTSGCAPLVAAGRRCPSRRSPL